MNAVIQIAHLLSDFDGSSLVDPPPTKLLDFDEALKWLVDHGPEVRAIITNSVVGMPKAFWPHLPNLELVANIGAGLENIDLEHVRQNGVRVTFTPDVLTDDVADLALGLTLCLFRNLVSGDSFVRAGRWGKHSYPLGSSVSSRHMGIVGLGRIGSAIARRAEAFGMRVGYCGRNVKEGVNYGYFGDITSLAEWADVLVAAVPGGPETMRMVNAKVFRALGSQGYFVNVARGSIVDECDLLAALKDGTIAGAALDVFDGEPAINSEYLKAPNLILSPHVGSATHETRRAMAGHAFANIRAFFSELPLQDEVRLS